MASDSNNETARPRIYELGFHINPMLAEDTVAEEFSKIKNLIEQHGGAFISEDAPRLRQLAYTVTKHIAGRNQRYDSAYFGWVKFEIDAAAIPGLKAAVDTVENVIRFLLIQTVRENTLVSRRPVIQKPDDDERSKAAPETPMSVEELDKTIDKLVIE